MVQASDLPELLKPAPEARHQPSRQQLAALVRARYPQLLAGNIVGRPVVTLLLNPDGTMTRSTLQVIAKPSGTLTASETRFEAFGLHSGELHDIGEAPVHLPGTTVFVIFGTRTDELLDLELLERYFPGVPGASIPGGEKRWILFDQAGHVRKYGAEGLQAVNLRKTLEQRYAGIHIAQAIVAPVMGRDGRPLQDLQHQLLELNCLWLAADSVAPPE